MPADWILCLLLNAMAQRFLQSRHSDESAHGEPWYASDEEHSPVKTEPEKPATTTVVKYVARSGYRSWCKPKADAQPDPEEKPAPGGSCKDAAQLRKAAAMAIAASSAAVKAGQAAASAAAALASGKRGREPATPPPKEAACPSPAAPSPKQPRMAAPAARGPAEESDGSGLPDSRKPSPRGKSSGSGLPDPPQPSPKGKGRGRGRGRGRGKAISGLCGGRGRRRGKAKAKPPASPADAAAKAKASPADGSPRISAQGEGTPVQGLGSEVLGDDTPLQGPESQALGEDTPQKGKKPRAKRGTVGTFAGYRPPKDPEKLELFQQMKAEYYTSLEASRPSGPQCRPSSKDGRHLTDNQKAYHSFMKSKMSELAKEGVEGPERMKAAAAAWRERVAEG